jgi:hypothetical protein
MWELPFWTTTAFNFKIQGRILVILKLIKIPIKQQLFKQTNIASRNDFTLSKPVFAEAASEANLYCSCCEVYFPAAAVGLPNAVAG